MEGLSPATTYYFVMKIGDEVPNWSDLSNLLEAVTPGSVDDPVPPAAVDDLDAALNEASRVHLRWTATGDDGHSGAATEYDIRYYASPIDITNWHLATMAAGEPDPTGPGTTQTFLVKNLEYATLYYFAMKARDEVSNWSAISNADYVTTPACEYSQPLCCFYSVWTSSPTPTAVLLHWSIYKGDTYAPFVYDIRYSTSPIDDWNWENATRCYGQPQRTDAGENWWNYIMRIDNLSPATTYYLAMRGVDGQCLTGLVTASATTDTDVSIPPP